MKLKDINLDWVEEFNGAVTICDLDGIIVYMNHYSIQQFKNYGGEKLLGSNLLECHPEPARTQLTQMLKSPKNNTYTTEKNGIKKIIHQTPWIENGAFKGLVEISFVLPADMPHFDRN